MSFRHSWTELVAGIGVIWALCSPHTWTVDATDRKLLAAPTTNPTVNASPPSSCLAALLSYPAASNGVYTLSAGGATYAAYCDMAGGGWELVMSAATNSSTFGFTSGLWEDSTLLNSRVPDPAAAVDAKYAGFVSSPLVGIRACAATTAVGGVGAAPCLGYSLPATYPSARSMFASTRNSSTANIQLGPDTAFAWLSLAGHNLTEVSDWYAANGWNASCFQQVGINFIDDTIASPGNGAMVRFGALYNNECSVHTADFAVGFGVRTGQTTSEWQGSFGLATEETGGGMGDSTAPGSLWILGPRSEPPRPPPPLPPLPPLPPPPAPKDWAYGQPVYSSTVCSSDCTNYPSPMVPGNAVSKTSAQLASNFTGICAMPNIFHSAYVPFPWITVDLGQPISVAQVRHHAHVPASPGRTLHSD